MPLGVRTRRAALGLVVLLPAALAGCQALPLRRAQQPAQPPAEVEFDPADWQPQPTANAPQPVALATTQPQPTFALGKRRGEPEAPSPPTPLLDAALERSRAQQQVVLSDMKGPAPLPQAIQVDALPADQSQTQPETTPAAAGPALVFSSPSDADAAVSPEQATRTTADAAEQTPSAQIPENVSLASQPASPLGPAPIESPPEAPGKPPAETSNIASKESAAADFAATRTSQSQPDEPAADSSASNENTTPGASAPEPEASAAGTAEVASTNPAESALAANEPALAVTDMRLCKRVRGFGNVEPIDSAACKPGQTVVLYCEMAGLRYEQTPGSPSAQGPYRSQLASWVEVVPDTGGEAVWSQSLGKADDLCSRPRRDYYVSYRLTLPPAATLPPGSYQLHLKQEDVLAGRSTTGTLPFTVQP